MLNTSKNPEYSQLLTTLCRQAGEELKAAFTKEEGIDHGGKVTRFPEVELRLMYLVAAFIKKYFPGDLLYGQDEVKDFSGNVWVCDPVDGSYFFMNSIPLYTFSISLLVEGKTKVAAIYEPVSERLYYAEKGKGTSINGKSIQIPTNLSVDSRFVVLSGQSDYVNFGELYKDLRKKDAKVLTTYSVVQHAARIVTGEIATVIYNQSFIQDVTAVKLIVEEAGGIVTDLRGNEPLISEQKIRGFIAAPAHLHPSILKLVTTHTLGD